MTTKSEKVNFAGYDLTIYADGEIRSPTPLKLSAEKTNELAAYMTSVFGKRVKKPTTFEFRSGIAYTLQDLISGRRG